ncbi:MAG: ankyrin repeat domain-containing protein [Spirochaetaceae bacterium]|nr:MAG: ankyrin repeat domain-containing protein [Spirochaetaceae bacterium]
MCSGADRALAGVERLGNEEHVSIFPQPRYIHSMKKHVFLALIWLCIALAVSAEAPWPQLTPEQWATLTPQQLKAKLSDGYDLQQRDGVGMTALMRAVQHTRDPEIVTMLVNAGSLVDVRDEGRWTPLIRAARSNPNPAVHALLIAAGADVNARNMADYTALIWAVRENPNPEVLELLLDAGANPALQGVDGRRAVDFLPDNSALTGSRAAMRLMSSGP